jgi:hypothetical protein
MAQNKMQRSKKKITFEQCINRIDDFLTESSQSPDFARTNAGVNQTCSSIQAWLSWTVKFFVVVVVVAVAVVAVEDGNHFLVSRFLRV